MKCLLSGTKNNFELYRKYTRSKVADLLKKSYARCPQGLDEVLALIVPFKRQVYEQVIAEFRHLAG